MPVTSAYESLKQTARSAPRESGVYLWRDEEGRIISVGKARVLRNRLSSYFSGGKDVKTTALIRRAASIETIITANEYEALLLENTLIKQHSPRYNINLKDGKTYPVIRLTSGDYPRIFRTRHIVEDGSRYFGPYPNIQAVDRMLELIEKLFPLRKCRAFKARKNPCMYYHIGRCRAPCCGRVSPEDYALHVERVRKLLSGENAALVAELNQSMRDEAAALRFEKAAEYRNAVRAIESLAEPIAVADFDSDSRDYIAWAGEGILTSFSVLSMRGGRMTGRELFNTQSAAAEEDTLDSFITAYYGPANPPPPRVYIQPLVPQNSGEGGPVSAPDPDTENAPLAPPGLQTSGFTPTPQAVPGTAVLRYFRESFGAVPEFPPAAGLEKRHEAALAMARQNAAEELRRRLRERGAGPALDEMAAVLGLRRRPERIEGFDIAQLDGRHPVASLISFKNGVPDRKNYRYFKLRTVVGIVDDFAAMREAVGRRYTRLLKENLELPDLILIDGGIGQVNAAKGVLDELGADIDVAGLAKRDEEIWLPRAASPIVLSRRSEALKVLQHVRDETHRFATGLNQKLRSKDLRFPVLESVEGVGPRRAAALMEQYGSLDAIAAASPESIAEHCGLPIDTCRAVRAAARLAAADKKQVRRRGGQGSGLPAGSGQTASLAEEALNAAENEPEYR